MTTYPVIGIRPTIDGRRGVLGVRESLEEQTMTDSLHPCVCLHRLDQRGGCTSQASFLTAHPSPLTCPSFSCSSTHSFTHSFIHLLKKY